MTAVIITTDTRPDVPAGIRLSALLNMYTRVDTLSKIKINPKVT